MVTQEAGHTGKGYGSEINPRLHEQEQADVTKSRDRCLFFLLGGQGREAGLMDRQRDAHPSVCAEGLGASC